MSQNNPKQTEPYGVPGAESVFSEFGIPPKQEAQPEHQTPSAAEAQKPARPPQQEATPAKEPATPSTAPAKKPAPKKSGTAARSSNASGKPQSPKGDRDTVRTTTTPRPSSPKKGTAAAEKSEKKGSDGMFRSSKPAHRVIPYILVIFSILLMITLLLNLFCNMGNKLASNPSAHWMGVVGYYICYGLFGLFGPAVYTLPVLIFNLGIFWKRYIDGRVTISKIIVSALALIMMAAFIHVFYLIPFSPEKNYTAKKLMSYGAQLMGGGVIGGKLAFFLASYLNIVGSIILDICLLTLAIFYCIGMTPQKLWNRFCINRAIKRAEKLEREAQRTAAPAEPPEHVKKKPAPEKEQLERDPEDKLAPIPMPVLDPSYGTRPFVPADVRRTLSEDARNTRMAASSSATQQTPPTAVSTEAPPITRAPSPTASGTPQKPINPAKNADSAIDPIFPKSSEAKQARRVPRQERNFDLKNVFVDLEDNAPPPSRPHVKLPPEVPMKGAPTAAAAPKQGVPTAPSPSAQPRTATAGQAPARPSASAQARAAQPDGHTAPSARPAAAPIRKSTPPPSYSSSPADTSDLKDFGLTSEEFEKLEAEKGITKLPPKGASKAPAKPAEKPTTPVNKPTKAEQKKYVFPPISYLHPVEEETEENQAEVKATIKLLYDTMNSFNVNIRDITHAHGPTVTRYELFPDTGVRVRSIVNLADDIALALAAGGIRIEAPIPGKSAVGIEVPNKIRRTVFLRQLIEDSSFTKATSKLTASLGADIAGNPLFFDISKMPHLLVAGTTNSGKSVCINCIIMSLLYKARADEVKLLLIDPKKVEFGVYKNIPHLLAPIITTPKDAAGALQASVEEMERRFNLFEQVGARDIKGYNETTKDDPDMPFLPYIVIIIDELADLMMTASDEVETAICRIAQKARAAGMHLIVGTQRPSVDVVTGLIKSNIPSRIAFTVASQVDSKTILDYAGAEKLAGRGDMLFAPIGALKPARVQGAFVDEKEVERICEFLRATNGTAKFDEGFISKLKELAAQCGNKGKGGGEPSAMSDGSDSKDDSLYSDAVRVAVEENRISTSLLQRKLSVGYGRAAKLIDRMQAEGIVSPPDGSKPRSVLITADDYIARFIDNKDKEKSGDEDGE